MRALPKIIWFEVLLLILLLGSFFAGAVDAKTFAYISIGVLVIFAIPAPRIMAAHRAKSETENG